MKNSLIIPLFWLLSLVSHAQTADKARRVYRTSDYLIIADSAGTNAKSYPVNLKNTGLSSKGNFIYVELPTGSIAYPPAKFLNQSGTPWSSVSAIAAFNAFMASAPSSGTASTPIDTTQLTTRQYVDPKISNLTSRVNSTSTAASNAQTTANAAQATATSAQTAVTAISATIQNPYLGVVSNRCFASAGIYTNNTQFMSRSRLGARDNITSLRIVIPNWYLSGTVAPYEIPTGGTATVEASVEYGGTITRALFSGVNSGTIASGATGISDFTTVNIPNGATYFVRIYWTNPAGILVKTETQQDAVEEGYEFANTGSLTNKVMSGTIGMNSPLSFSPIAVVAMTTKPSVLLFADSRGAGVGGTIVDGSGEVGNVSPSIGPFMGYINCAVGSDKIQNFITSSTRRQALAQYVSHVIISEGINDMGRTVAQIQADLVTASGLFPTRKVFGTTVEPQSTDATTVNSTVNTKVTALNKAIRGNLQGYAGFFDLSDAVSTARDSGLWKPGYSSDWLHALNAGYQAIKYSGVIPIGAFLLR